MKAIVFNKDFPVKGIRKQWAYPLRNEWGSTDIPYLLSSSATMKGLAMFFPHLPIDIVKLVEVEITLKK